MNRGLGLGASVAVVAAVSWLPSILEPSAGFPPWLPLAVIGLSTGLATILSGGRWFRFLAIAAISTLAGMLTEFMIWPLEDGIAQSYAIFAVLAAALAVAVVCFLTGIIGGAVTPLASKRTRAVWLAFAACVAFGPAELAVRPGVIEYRVAHNERLAAERFSGLKAAIEKTRMEQGGADRLCDGQSLRENYNGPPFSQADWQRLAGNYVKEDGYLIGIWIDCSRPARYSIDLRPERPRADGIRKFCTDQSGKIGCGVEWRVSPRQEEECTPCSP
jgi:hypothetical protein